MRKLCIVRIGINKFVKIMYTVQTTLKRIVKKFPGFFFRQKFSTCIKVTVYVKSV